MLPSLPVKALKIRKPSAQTSKKVHPIIHFLWPTSTLSLQSPSLSISTSIHGNIYIYIYIDSYSLLTKPAYSHTLLINTCQHLHQFSFFSKGFYHPNKCSKLNPVIYKGSDECDVYIKLSIFKNIFLIIKKIVNIFLIIKKIFLKMINYCVPLGMAHISKIHL